MNSEFPSFGVADDIDEKDDNRVLELEAIASRQLLLHWVKKYAPHCVPGAWEYDKEASDLCEETAKLLGIKVPWGR